MASAELVIWDYTDQLTFQNLQFEQLQMLLLSKYACAGNVPTDASGRKLGFKCICLFFKIEYYCSDNVRLFVFTSFGNLVSVLCTKPARKTAMHGTSAEVYSSLTVH